MLRITEKRYNLGTLKVLNIAGNIVINGRQYILVFSWWERTRISAGTRDTSKPCKLPSPYSLTYCSIPHTNHKVTWYILMIFCTIGRFLLWKLLNSSKMFPWEMFNFKVCVVFLIILSNVFLMSQVYETEQINGNNTRSTAEMKWVYLSSKILRVTFVSCKHIILIDQILNIRELTRG